MNFDGVYESKDRSFEARARRTLCSKIGKEEVCGSVRRQRRVAVVIVFGTERTGLVMQVIRVKGNHIALLC